MVMESIKKRTKPHFSLNETSKQMKELNKQLKSWMTDSTVLFLLRQHTRTHFISYAFMRALEDDLIVGKSIEQLQAIILNALDYVKKNIKYFMEIVNSNNMSGGKLAHKASKKDLNANPFGVVGSSTTRNSSNKENYGGNSNTQKNASSKSEKKMFIKQNIQISLAFLKKICRLTKGYQEKFKEFIAILTHIEYGTQSKIKDMVKRSLTQLKNEQKTD